MGGGGGGEIARRGEDGGFWLEEGTISLHRALLRFAPPPPLLKLAVQDIKY